MLAIISPMTNFALSLGLSSILLAYCAGVAFSEPDNKNAAYGDFQPKVTGHWGRCPTAAPIDRPSALQPKYKHTRSYFCREVHICGIGVENTSLWIRDEEKRYPFLLNRKYVIYRTSDEKREHPLGELRIKNGNGFIDKFKMQSASTRQQMFDLSSPDLSFSKLESLFGKAEENLLHGSPHTPIYPEQNVRVFVFDAVDRQSGSFSKFQLAVYTAGDTIKQYVISGPGIVCQQPKPAVVDSILQYTPEATFWVRLRSDEKAPIPSFSSCDELFEFLDQKISTKLDITPVPDSVDYTGSFGPASGQAERHRRTSPTMPDGPPIPDSR